MKVLFIYGILLGILRYTTAWTCADVEYSISITKVPKTISYQQAVSKCEADGKKLCSSKTVCKDGKPYLGVILGDHWVPVADSPNEWMQIGILGGSSKSRLCILHSNLGFKPAWGLTNSAFNFKGNLFCCKTKRQENSITIKAVLSTISYQQALADCQTDGKELCTSKEICEDGKTPYSGPIPGDHWVPVKDSLNEWLEIGADSHKPCLLHSQLGSKPNWGLTTANYVFKGFLFCCKK